MTEKEFLDLGQLTRVLDEIDSTSSIFDDWGELAKILTEINDEQTLKNKLYEILKWINDHPMHTYPKKVQGWINTIQSQFCPNSVDISAETIVDHMVKLKILYIYNYNKQVQRQLVYTNKVNLLRKRCRSEVIDEEFDGTQSKRYKNNME